MHRPVSAPSLARRLARDTRGVSAVEFALIAPILIMMYFALAEFCQGYMAQKRMGHVTSQIADIVAQTDVVTRSEVTDIFAIGDLIMNPFPAAALSMRVSSVTRGSDGVARVDWSRGQGMTARSGTVSVPADLISNGQSIVMSEATYNYNSPIGQLLPGTTTFRGTYYLRPRLVAQVGCSNC